MRVVTGEEMHLIDRYTMDQIGLSEDTLMENAGQAVVRELLPKLNKDERTAVLIGAGNNGGDGFVIARLLHERGYNLTVWVIPPYDRIRGTAAVHRQIYENCGYTFKSYEEHLHSFAEDIEGSAAIVDALLGTGITGELRPPYDSVTSVINEAGGTVYSVDIPSGVPSSEAEEFASAVKADETLTLQAPKQTAYLYPYADYYGKLTVVDIGIPEKAFSEVAPERFVLMHEDIKGNLAARKPDAHKGDSGRALVIGGSREMTGAPVMTAHAALRTGAGLVTMAVPESILQVVSAKTEECMYKPLPDENGALTAGSMENLETVNFDGIAIGPGAGRNHKLPLFETFRHFNGVLVADADGLFHVAKEKKRWQDSQRPGPIVLTPHPGEMAMLAGKSVTDVQKRRFEVARETASAYNAYVVLKGPFTIVTTPEGRQYVNTSGNAALAKGGSGDVLTGMILGMLLQYDDIEKALCHAVYIHGLCAEKLTGTKDIFGVTATDLIYAVPEVLHSLRY